MIYHASFTDDETLDMLEAAKDRVFVAPGIAILYAMLHEAEAYGITHAKATAMGYQIEWDAALESLRKMHKRGIRVLPGGDYGFAFTPHCQNARDLEFFVKYLGFTPMEAIRSRHAVRRPDHDAAATSWAPIKEGYLADLLLVDGDPLANLSILRDPKRILAVMKDGEFAKAPPTPRRGRALSARAGSAPHDARARSAWRAGRGCWSAARSLVFAVWALVRQRARCSSSRCSTA